MADNTLEINKTALWWEHYKALHGYRVTVSQGGSSSGKTYCILDCLLYMMCTEKNLVITVVSVSYPSIRRGSFRDTMSIWQDSPMYKAYISKPTINGCACEATGSVLEYASYHDTISARSGKRDILYINEANGIPFEIAHELIIRTRKCMVFDYNPNTKFWVHSRYENNSQAKWIFSTHKANPYLPQAIHDELEALKFSDPEKYKVYGLGVSGQIEGCVITDWALCDDLPEKSECKWVCWGLDWGFQNDPTALVEVRFAHGMLWARELIYKKGMTNFDIAETIKQLGLQNEEIICDSAEQKSISELHRLGVINARAAIKGPGTVQAGLDLMKTYKIMVTRDSDNLKSELLNYKYKTDALGHFANVPEDRWNHILDAARYTVSYKFEKPKARTYLGRM